MAAYLWNLHQPYFIIPISADRASELCSAARWVRLMNFGISNMKKRNELRLLPILGPRLLQLLYGGYSVCIYIKIFLIRAAALSDGQFKVLCVCWGPYAGWQMFISQVAFHLSVENNGLALCPALS